MFSGHHAAPLLFSRQLMKTRLAAAVCYFAPAAVLLAQAAEPPSSNPDFLLGFKAGAIVSLQQTHDSSRTEFITSGRRLGDVSLKYRQGTGDWEAANTASLAEVATFSTNADGTRYSAAYQITNSASPELAVEIHFAEQPHKLVWTLTVRNQTDQPMEIGDLAIPLPISRSSGRQGKVLLKHSFISGHASFLYWMRSDSAAPFLTMVPSGDTHLEYWEGSRDTGYRVFIHSAAAGAVAAQHGTKWRQPNTSLTLAPKGRPGDAHSYAFTFRWADSYDGVRQVLVDEDGIDVQVVPGMTVPSDLFAEFALRTKQKIKDVETEFPDATRIESLGTNDETHLFKVRFSKLGENRLTVHYGDDRQMFLEWFSTEPLETLIKKRGAFLEHSQHRDPAKWYNGLITDWNMDNHTLLSPDNYAPIPRGRVYAVTCDDPGLGKPAFLAAKNAEYPVQSEVDALDYYIQHFVWGGLQRTTDEKYSYGIYGIPNWKVNRDSADTGRNGQLHIWREYDYPHVIQMYFAMYRLAAHHPEIKTALTAREYLQRAYGTAEAFFTVPHEVWSGWSPYGTGFYNELVMVDLMDELQANAMTNEAATLRGFWEQKAAHFVNDGEDLFRSEYAFDSTGFESTHALAKYAVQHATQPGNTNFTIRPEDAARFMEVQMAANIFCRGWLEPAYYYLGSDYRGGAGNGYVLTYMSQMGGWSVLDYALNFATNPCPYLRLGYASYLSAWALMNTGTPASNYGYWYPGEANDGGAGGGFEPAAFGQTWLGQPHHRGSWYYSSEIDLGYCGALRTAATVLADDSIFGRFCFGGDWRTTATGIEIVPKDGLRRRFHALLNGSKLHLVLDNDRFAAGQPLVLKADLSEFRFQLESDNPAPHVVKLRWSGPTGARTVKDTNGPVINFESKSAEESIIELPMEAGGKPKTFTVAAKTSRL
jgi:Family of unknown function (DUF5695)